MLQIANEPLPQSLLSYVAFRVACRLTSQTLCDHGADWIVDEGGLLAAYLAEVPFLREVALPVQLELLSTTWERHLSSETHQATLLDEAVVYAVCEFAARVCEADPALITRSLRGGPLDVTVPTDDVLAAELRNLYLRMSNDGDFLLLSQFLDMPPEEAAEWKSRLGMDDEFFLELWDSLSRWRVAPDLLGNLTGLISVEEARKLARVLRVEVPA